MLAFKLGTLLIKQITKPVASELKRAAVQDGFFRSICKRYGQLHHRIESRLTIRSAGHRSTKVKDVSEEVAVQTGANVLSEAFVFSVAAGLLVFEVQRKNKQDEAAKREKQRIEAEHRVEIERRFNVIEASLQRLEQQLYSRGDTSHIRVSKPIDHETKYFGWFRRGDTSHVVHKAAADSLNQSNTTPANSTSTAVK